MTDRKMQSPTRQTIVEGRQERTSIPQIPQEFKEVQDHTLPSNLAKEDRLADYFAIVGLSEDLKPLDVGYDCKYIALKMTWLYLEIRTIEKVEIVIMERWEVSEIKK